MVQVVTQASEFSADQLNSNYFIRIWVYLEIGAKLLKKNVLWGGVRDFKKSFWVELSSSWSTEVGRASDQPFQCCHSGFYKKSIQISRKKY